MNTINIREAADPITKDNVCVEEQHFKRQTQYNFKKRKCHVSHYSPIKKKTCLSVTIIKKIPIGTSSETIDASQNTKGKEKDQKEPWCPKQK